MPHDPATTSAPTTEHVHPLNPEEKVRGRRLTAGEKIEKGDLYDCSDGRWKKMQKDFFGSKVPSGGHIIYVRPEATAATEPSPATAVASQDAPGL